VTRGTKLSAAGLLLLLASLGGYEGTRYVAYRDIAGIWTVCEGVTGDDVIRGKVYTPDECRALLTKHVYRYEADLERCVRAPMSESRRIGLLHLIYNIGPTAFCRSTLARRLNAGDPDACAEISRWTFVAGKDCRVPANNCGGIVQRRDYFERPMCEGRS
jgi:lysozyme